MTQPRRDGVYIWMTRLTRLFVGEYSCEWSAAPGPNMDTGIGTGASTFDRTGWQLARIVEINEHRRPWQGLSPPACCHYGRAPTHGMAA